MQTKATAKINLTITLVEIPSPIKWLVNIANDIIPIAKPINLPGHNVPSKAIKANLVAQIYPKLIGIPNKLKING